MRRSTVWCIAVLALVGSGCNNGGTDPPDVATGMDVDASTAMDAATDAWTATNILPDGAPNPCLAATDCASCTSLTPCGWCSGHCLAGTETSSYDTTCSGAQWLWRGIQCGGGEQCAMHIDCTSCASDPDACGWCANRRTCVAGDATGPAMPLDGCTAAARTWIYNLDTNTCP